MTCARGCCASFAEHIRSLTFTGWSFAETEAKGRRMAEDHQAFRNLRANGLKPGKLTGAANLERAAEIPQEVGLGMILPKDVKTALKNGDGEIVGL